MRKYRVDIQDGFGVWFCFHVVADSEYSALKMVILSWQDYGIPYGIKTDGIKDIKVGVLYE